MKEFIESIRDNSEATFVIVVGILAGTLAILGASCQFTTMEQTKAFYSDSCEGKAFALTKQCQDMESDILCLQQLPNMLEACAFLEETNNQEQSNE